jgi:hypothetical protein
LAQAKDQQRARDAIKIRAADYFFIDRPLLGFQSLIIAKSTESATLLSSPMALGIFLIREPFWGILIIVGEYSTLQERGP